MANESGENIPSSTARTGEGDVAALAAMEREVLTWEGFGVASRELARQVVESRFDPDIIIAIARGGLVPAGAVSYAMGTKAAGTLNVELYTDVNETLTEPVVLPPFLDRSALSDKRVLVVDDVADSGKTLATVLELLAADHCEVRSAVLYSKPRSVIEPDFVWRNTDLWITFPWSSEPIISL